MQSNFRNGDEASDYEENRNFYVFINKLRFTILRVDSEVYSKRNWYFFSRNITTMNSFTVVTIVLNFISVVCEYKISNNSIIN